MTPRSDGERGSRGTPIREPREDLIRPQLGQPHHYAYVVEDIAATVDRLVDQLGAGPFFCIQRVPLENVLSRGEPAEFVHNSAFGSCGDAVIELIEAVSLAPERVQKGFSGPRPRIQHVAYVVPSTEVAEVRSSLDERGLPQYLSSQLGAVDTTLHDASAVLGHDLEIHVEDEVLGVVRHADDVRHQARPLRELHDRDGVGHLVLESRGRTVRDEVRVQPPAT